MKYKLLSMRVIFMSVQYSVHETVDPLKVELKNGQRIWIFFQKLWYAYNYEKITKLVCCKSRHKVVILIDKCYCTL